MRPVCSRSSRGQCAWSAEVRGEWTRAFQRAGGGQAMWGLVGHTVRMWDWVTAVLGSHWRA